MTSASAITPSELVAEALAVHRITRFVLADELAAPARTKFWKLFPPSSKVGYLITCPWCTSIWAGASLQLLRATLPRVHRAVVLALAASTATGVLFERGIG